MNIKTAFVALCAFTLFLTSACQSSTGKGVDSKAVTTKKVQTPDEEAASASGFVKPSDPGLKYVGRISFRNPNAPVFGYTGAQIYANFTGTSLRMKVKPNSGFFVAVIDGGKPIKVQSLKDSLITFATHLKEGTHSLLIAQDTEAADVNFPVFYGLKLDKGARLAKAPELPERKIEFIGNSITCGKGALDKTVKKDHDELGFESWYISYDAEIARRLNAQCMVVARSGIGIYRNNGDPKLGGKPTIQDYYSHTLLDLKSEEWDFANYEPQLVCVNLGTNDTAQTYDVEMFKKAAKKFLGDVRGHYPNAKIVVLTGPMRSGKRLADQKAALDYAVNQLKAAGEKEMYRFDVPYDTGRFGYGTGHHPAEGEHKYMADLLTPYLQKLMGW